MHPALHHTYASLFIPFLRGLSSAVNFVTFLITSSLKSHYSSCVGHLRIRIWLLASSVT